MTTSSTVLALILMPFCLWVYSRAWLDTPLVRLLPLGAVSLTLGSTLLPIAVGVFLRYRAVRLADLLVKVRQAAPACCCAAPSSGICLSASRMAGGEMGTGLAGSGEPSSSPPALVASRGSIPGAPHSAVLTALGPSRQIRGPRSTSLQRVSRNVAYI